MSSPGLGENRAFLRDSDRAVTITSTYILFAQYHSIGPPLPASNVAYAYRWRFSVVESTVKPTRLANCALRHLVTSHPTQASSLIYSMLPRSPVCLDTSGDTNDLSVQTGKAVWAIPTYVDVSGSLNVPCIQTQCRVLQDAQYYASSIASKDCPASWNPHQ